MKTTIQGTLWCTACHGRKYAFYCSVVKGIGSYWVTCPICKGTGKNTFKGKHPITNDQTL